VANLQKVTHKLRLAMGLCRPIGSNTGRNRVVGFLHERLEAPWIGAHNSRMEPGSPDMEGYSPFMEPLALGIPLKEVLL